MANRAPANPVPGDTTTRTRVRNVCLDDPHFLAALREIAALGLQVTMTARPHGTPYAVLPGRSQRRWYLLPCRPHSVRCASLALIQPLRRGPRAAKRALAAAAWLGLPPLRPTARVYISGRSRIASVFGTATTSTAFLTGTAGPHRKLTAQFMDANGGIKGYAKVACVPAAQALLASEAAMLTCLGSADLRCAALPRVLLHEPRAGGAALLATDTVRMPPGRNRTRLGPAHVAFLNELAARTADAHVPDGAALLRDWYARGRNLEGRLPAGWPERFESALATLAATPDLIAPKGLAHGDFSPSNTFPYRGRLYAFDWEYAGYAYPADFDLIGFLFATYGLRGLRADQCLAAVTRTLTNALGRTPEAARVRLVAYLCCLSLLRAERRPYSAGTTPAWAGEPAAACMLDTLRAHGPHPTPGNRSIRRAV